MAFTTLSFALFVTILMLVYFAMHNSKYQWVVLLIGSYGFYLFTGIQNSFFIITTTITTYLAALYIGRNSRSSKATLKENKEKWSKEERKAFKQNEEKKRRRIMVTALLLNFGILFMLKYYGFMANGINSLFAADAFPSFKFLLPLGISFYTFQSASYLIDVYRGDTDEEINLAKFALFVSFFPQIIQGPISTYDQLAPQLYQNHKPDYIRFKFGLELVLWGLFKKLVIADRALPIIDSLKELTPNDNPNGSIIVLLILVYAIWLYADFSSGIDIARAVAQSLGIDMIQNFRQPYFATSLTDYWNRWHISLGAWMRNYVFYPLALSDTASAITEKISASKAGQTKIGNHIANVLPGALASLIVFLLVGIWHGAELKYIYFGIWNGLVIMLSIIIAPLMDRLNVVLHINPSSFRHRVFRIIRTFILVCIGYYFDVAETARESLFYLRHSFVSQNFADATTLILSLNKYTLLDGVIIIMTTILLFAVSVLREQRPDVSLRSRIHNRSTAFQWILLFVFIMTLLVLGVYGPGYDPKDFAYMQF